MVRLKTKGTAQLPVQPSSQRGLVRGASAVGEMRPHSSTRVGTAATAKWPAASAPLHVDLDQLHLPGEVMGEPIHGRAHPAAGRAPRRPRNDKSRDPGALGERDEAIVGVDDTGKGLAAEAAAREPVAAAGIRILNPVSSGLPLGGGRCNPHRDRRKLLMPVKPARAEPSMLGWR